jgi:tRNA-intron endonuclease
MSSIKDLKAAISTECEITPFVQVTSLCKEKTSKRRKLSSKPVTQLAYGVKGSVSNDSPGNVAVTNPHDAASIYMSGCYGKGSMSKGTPVGFIDGSEHLILSPCESMYLSEMEALVVIQHDDLVLSRLDLWKLWSDHDSTFCQKFTVYKHFRDRKYIVRSGIKYGGDFMLYSGDPNTTHAAYVVKVMVSDDIPWTDVNALRRVSESVAKECVLAYVNFDESVDRSHPNCVTEATVTHVLLKRWIPERNREIVAKTLKQ